MRLYRLQYHHDDSGNNLLWFSSRARARAAWSRLKGRVDSPDFNDAVSFQSIMPVEVPTRRRELIKFLNQNLTLDNG